MQHVTDSRNGSARGRTALVTGGGTGIGRACALRLAADGHAVAVAGRDRAKLDATVAAVRAAGGRAEAVVLDVTDEESVHVGLGDATAALGAPTVLVNNAGIAESSKFSAITAADWDRTFAVNARGPFLLAQACLPAMLAAGRGRIVMIGSTASVQGFPYVAHYVASKHALLGLARALALEVAAKGVTVNCVCPGYVDTELTQRSVENIVRTTGKSADEARAALAAMSPQKRLMTPAEIADTVAWLCSDGAAGVNGQAVVVNGG